MNIRKISIIALSLLFFMIAVVATFAFYLHSDLPDMITLKDYENATPQVSEVYDRQGKKIGEFFNEKRILVPLDKTPQIVKQAFLAAEDAGFYKHGGINFLAIARAFVANLRAGDKVQGASTITQQVARSILLSREKTYSRKIKEILLSYKMEKNLSKDDILYLYLNHIFLGQEANGIAVAADVYFSKKLEELTLAEAAILAGLPKAPSAYSPLRNPARAKERQVYVLSRMVSEGMITKDQADAAAKETVKVFKRRSYWNKAPHFLETVRQMLIEKLGVEMVFEKGLRIYTALDLEKQSAAQDQVQLGLRELDKRQGFRGTAGRIEDPEEVGRFLLEERDRLIEEENPFRMLQIDGTLSDWGPLNLTGVSLEDKKTKLPPAPDYAPIGTFTKGIVTQVDDQWGLVYVRFAEGRGIIDLDNMKWARPPDPEKNAKYAEELTKPSQALKKGDVIELKVIGKKFFSTRLTEKLAELQKKQKKNFKRPESLPTFDDYCELQLEQTPLTQAALLAVDQKTNEIVSMVGGYEFSSKNQLNRAIQAMRQTGSSFKPFVYLAALDKGYTPSTQILDAPIVFEEEQEVEGSDSREVIIKKWKPTNHSNQFTGDILFRNALIQSLNIPSVKIIEKTGVPWAVDYARRLGIFSPLNMDYTLALGSSSVTLYEMVKAFAQIGKLGQKVTPILIHKVEDREGKVILGETSLDERFKKEVDLYDEYFKRRRANYLAYKTAQEAEQAFNPPFPIGSSSEVEGPALPSPEKEPPFYDGKPEQLIKPQTAYVLTSLLRAATEEEGATGRRAASLNRPVAGKTGTTSNYFDAWFLGYTMDIAAGVWVGFDEEKTLGRGEVGGRAALPIWAEYMKVAHGNLPARDFPIPDGIVFSSIDNETGRLASSRSKQVVKQAFIEGTEPKEVQDDSGSKSSGSQDFFKEDLNE
jgi:penicillin-binding protein 1A